MSDLSRLPTEIEQAARTDFLGVQSAWEVELARLIEQWQLAVTPAARAELLDQITALVESGQTEELGAVAVTAATVAVGAALLAGTMLALATEAAGAVIGEAAAQGVSGIEADGLDTEWLEKRARATAELLSGGLAASAGRTAASHAVPGKDAGSVRQAVSLHLDALADRALRDQLGAALTAAQNAGRLAAMSGAEKRTADRAAEYYAVEILDKNTCVHPDSLVTTERGAVRADRVEPDDRLLTHSGRWMPISRTVISDVAEDLAVIHLADDRELRLTTDHPVLVLDGARLVWRSAGEIARGAFVVDQASAEGGRKVDVPDLVLGQSPDGVSTADQIRRLTTVRTGAQGVPVRSVGFDRQSVIEHEVNGPRPDLNLCDVGVPEQLQALADPALDTGLQAARPVAGAGAITPNPRLRGGAPGDRAAQLASHHDGRTATRFAAVPPTGGLPVPEPPPAPGADAIDAPPCSGAGARAIRVPVGVRCGDLEDDFAVRARLGDPVARRPELRPTLGVGNGAGVTAIDGGRLIAGGDSAATHLAQLPGTLSQPARLRSTTPAHRPHLDTGPALGTRRVHYLSVVEVTDVGRERYAGSVYDFTVPGDRTFFADGVLVHNCDDCAKIDGTQFANLAAASEAYLTGGYVNCQGRDRCRGIVVAVWNTDIERATMSAKPKARVTTPKAVALKNLPDVELVAVGSWNASTGPVTITNGDLMQALAAMECPAIGRPVLKLGHAEPEPNAKRMRWDGEPAIGWISNLRLSANKAKLVGDYTGVPGWLVDVMPSAYPKRSVEVEKYKRCQIGHRHPFVLTGVSLLGVEPPAVGAIRSLNDVQKLYTQGAEHPEDAAEVIEAIEATLSGSAPIAIRCGGRVLFGKVLMHLPGKHNQETHGNDVGGKKALPKKPGGKAGALSDADFNARAELVGSVIGKAMKTMSTDKTFTNEAGAWAPERDRLHREVADAIYRRSNNVPNDARAVIAGGLGGAGKTTVLTKHAGVDTSQYMTINPDDIKEELAERGVIPEVPGAPDLSPMERAALVHEESSRIAHMLADRAYAERRNVMWDITMSSESSVKSRVAAMQAAGYTEIKGVFVDIPVETSVERAMARYRRGVESYLGGEGFGGRYVPPAIIRAQKTSSGETINHQVFESIRGSFSDSVVYDNSVTGQAPRKVG